MIRTRSERMAGAGSPCGACKFLRRKCVANCIFAPYFCSEQGAARFAAIHKIFGASNVSKLLLHVPASERSEAVVTIAYEADARIKDPVYGCVSQIFALQQQVATLQAQVMQAKAQLAHNMGGLQLPAENQWAKSGGGAHPHHPHGQYTTGQQGTLQPRGRSCRKLDNETAAANYVHHGRSFNDEGASPPSESSTDCVDNEGESFFPHSSAAQNCNMKWLPHDELGELQALALRMMGN
ncbi:LOB domain-containing protein 16-like isoform X2 [Nymphaea colorata]|uniref:LOB domain-containing protein 16-like isoform X2 n=1 Tax=Nymphaea colorata TaxID=210225 RepID=UPI00129D5B9A|nr:LOB domain-containing protein 16-like isoform X2 [Nymphaea colorata]